MLSINLYVKGFPDCTAIPAERSLLQDAVQVFNALLFKYFFKAVFTCVVVESSQLLAAESISPTTCYLGLSACHDTEDQVKLL